MNSFDTTTGRFTAPVAGLYMIGAQWMRSGSNGTGITIRFRKNNSTMYARQYQPGVTWSYETVSLMSVTTMAVGDYITMYNDDPYTVSFYDDDSYFFAYFLG
jgi:hypothetical protein